MASSVCTAVPLLSTRKYTTTTESILHCSAVVMLTQTDAEVATATARAKASRSSAFSPFTVQKEPMERTAAFVSLLRCASPSLLLPRQLLRAANCFTLPCTRLAASRCSMCSMCASSCGYWRDLRLFHVSHPPPARTIRVLSEVRLHHCLLCTFRVAVEDGKEPREVVRKPNQRRVHLLLLKARQARLARETPRLLHLLFHSRLEPAAEKARSLHCTPEVASSWQTSTEAGIRPS